MERGGAVLPSSAALSRSRVEPMGVLCSYNYRCFLDVITCSKEDGQVKREHQDIRRVS